MWAEVHIADKRWFHPIVPHHPLRKNNALILTPKEVKWSSVVEGDLGSGSQWFLKRTALSLASYLDPSDLPCSIVLKPAPSRRSQAGGCWQASLDWAILPTLHPWCSQRRVWWSGWHSRLELLPSVNSPEGRRPGETVKGEEPNLKIYPGTNSLRQERVWCGEIWTQECVGFRPSPGVWETQILLSYMYTMCQQML